MKALDNLGVPILRTLIIMLTQFSLPLAVIAQVPPTPQIICVSTIDATSDIVLQWEISDQTNVSSYNIMWSQSASGPFTQIGFLNDGSFNRQLTGFNGNIVQYFFYMYAIDALGNISQSSDIVSNILLKMPLPPPPNGIASLQWNPFNSSVQESYNVVRTIGATPSIIHTGSELSYTDIITYPNCNDTNINYHIEITGVCNTYSNTRTGTFKDVNKPSDVIMDIISISDGHPLISWIPSASEDVAGYEIKRLLPGILWPTIGFAPGNLTTSFTASSINACDDIITFAVITRDQCLNTSESFNNFLNPLNTLLLNLASWDDCKGKVLAWNPYNHMDPPLGEYQVFRQENSGAFVSIGNTNPNTTTYTDTYDFTRGVTYGYRVRAISGDGSKTSTSCEVSFLSDRPASPDTVFLNYVTVRNSKYVEMGIHFSPAETVKILRILRADSEAGPFIVIDSVFPGNLADIVIDDTTAKVNQQSYYYKIDAVDSCDIALTSSVARTIYLECQPNPDESNTLSWNGYEGWTGTIDHYEVYRMVNNVPDLNNPIANLPSGTSAYTDFPPASVQAGDILSYYVNAIEGAAASPDTSISNIVQAVRQPLVMMPNAFVPGGAKNNRFLPVMTFVDDGNYLLLICNKWGQQVFSSTDRSEGWDGIFNGEYAPGGIYFYRLQYTSLMGESFSKNGSLILIR